MVFGLVGGGVMLLRYIWQRTNLILAQEGLFPVVRGRAAGQTYYHDPNRQWAGTVAYGSGPDGLQARSLLPSGAEGYQTQISTQAQATQLIAAASQGGGMPRHTRQAVQRMIQAPQATTRMPEIVTLDTSVSEERRLLAAILAEMDAE